MPTGTMHRVQQVITGVAGSPYYIVGYFDASAGTAVQAADAWRTLVGGSAPSLPTGAQSSTNPEVAEVSSLTGETLSVVTISVPAPIVGTNGNTLAPPATQLLLRWKTGIFIGGRRLQGHTNLPNVFANQIGTQGQVLAATVTGANAAIATFLGGTNYKHVVYSKKNHQFWPTTSGTTWGQFAVLRSRRD